MRTTIERCQLTLRAPLVTARGTLRRRTVFVVRVEHDGRVGFGEAAPLPAAGTEGSDACAAALERAAGLLADGVLPLDAPGAWEGLLLGALGGAPAARHAIDLALWDLDAQGAGVPLCRRLAEEPAMQVRVSALLGGPDPAAAAQTAVDAAFEVLKLKVGARSLAEDTARIAAVRRAAPSARLRLDANGAWPNARTALAALHALGLERVESVEQPVPTHDRLGLAWLRGRVEASIAADEAVLDEKTGLTLLEEDAVDAIVLKPMKLGGLGPCLRLARQAAQRGVRVWLTTTIDGAVARRGALHLAAALDPNGREAHGLATGAMLACDVAATEEPQRGTMAVPQRSGLGLDRESVRVPK